MVSVIMKSDTMNVVFVAISQNPLWIVFEKAYYISKILS